MSKTRRSDRWIRRVPLEDYLAKQPCRLGGKDTCTRLALFVVGSPHFKEIRCFMHTEAYAHLHRIELPE